MTAPNETELTPVVPTANTCYYAVFDFAVIDSCVMYRAVYKKNPVASKRRGDMAGNRPAPSCEAGRSIKDLVIGNP